MKLTIIGLLSTVALGDEENCCRICAMESVLHLCVRILDQEASLNGQFQCVMFFYRLTQYDASRKLLIKNLPLESVLDKVLAMLGSSSDVSFVAVGTINNLALDKSFIEKFEEKLSSVFIPGIVKMMDVLCVTPIDDERVSKNFLPVMKTSISTISNLFQSNNIRRRFKDHDLWNTSVQLIWKYSNQQHDNNKQRIIHATLGMLMNLSVEPAILEKPSRQQLISFSKILLDYPNYTDEETTERCYGLWSHLLKNNPELLKEAVLEKIHNFFIDNIKSGKVKTRKHSIKCMVFFTSSCEDVCYSLHKKKGIEVLLDILSDSMDETEIGNTALCISHLSKYKMISDSLASSGLIKKLLVHATNEMLSKTVRHNCAVAIGKFALADERFLQQLRDLHGMEILHEVIKENKMV